METIAFSRSNPTHGPAIVALWNRTLGDAYPLLERLLQQNLDENPNFRPEDAVLAWDGDDLVGFALLQRYRGDEPHCQGWRTQAWLAAVVVAPGHQRQGIGTRMVSLLQEGARLNGVTRIQPAGGIFWFFPGVPNDLPAARPFFESLGFRFGPTVYDLRADLTWFQMPEQSARLIAGHGMTIRRCTATDIDDLLAFILAEFGGNWWYNASAFFDAGGAPDDWLLMLNDAAIVGMARLHHPDQAVIGAARYWLHTPNAGGLGPIGVAASLRGQGLGLTLLHETIVHLQSLGVTDAIADWTDLVDFYAKVGFRPWKQYATSRT